MSERRQEKTEKRRQGENTHTHTDTHTSAHRERERERDQDEDKNWLQCLRTPRALVSSLTSRSSCCAIIILFAVRPVRKVSPVRLSTFPPAAPAINPRPSRASNPKYLSPTYSLSTLTTNGLEPTQRSPTNERSGLAVAATAKRGEHDPQQHRIVSACQRR